MSDISCSQHRLRNVQRIIKLWKDCSEPSSSRRECGRIRNLEWSRTEITETFGEIRSLKNQQWRPCLIVRASPHLQCEENSVESGLNSCAAWRKPLNSEANRIKLLQFVREHKIWPLERLKKKSSWGLNEPRFTLFQSDGPIRVRREVDCKSLWGQCDDLGLIQLVRSKFSYVMCQLTTWTYWMTRFFTQWVFLLVPDGTEHRKSLGCAGEDFR